MKTIALFVLLMSLVVNAVLFAFVIKITEYNFRVINGKVEVICLAISKRTVGQVKFKHKYRQTNIYQNFARLFEVECNRMLKMRK